MRLHCADGFRSPKTVRLCADAGLHGLYLCGRHSGVARTCKDVRALVVIVTESAVIFVTHPVSDESAMSAVRSFM